jgi:hypothetical protein
MAQPLEVEAARNTTLAQIAEYWQAIDDETLCEILEVLVYGRRSQHFDEWMEHFVANDYGPLRNMATPGLLAELQRRLELRELDQD